ncbi:MAG: hypothetical protein O2909_12660 [Chloroflexi bacterium]|nr:hypothetical protein [Chloroflexota bacterium]MDA1220265.1 hypothetical protein [Chloroflexota bacterium]
MARPPSGAAPQIKDSRIAVCLPGSGVYRQRDRITDEIATIRETQALYLAQRDPEADLIRRTLQQRQKGLEDEIMTQEVTRYSAGTVLTGPEHRSVPEGLFSGTDPVSWFSRVSAWLLSNAYPDLPIDSAALSRPITQDDAGHLFGAIFTRGRPRSDTTSSILAELGVGLGLSSADRPEVFAPEQCPVLELIRDKLAQSPEPAPWSDQYYFLAHQVGLTGALASLYLLIYLRQASPEQEVRLSDDHQLALSNGRSLHGNRLTADLLPHLIWDSRIGQWANTIGPATPASWNDSLNYLVIISPDLKPVPIEESPSPSEQRLLRDVETLTELVSRGRDLLALFSHVPGNSLEASEAMSESLDRLARISGDDFRSVPESVRNTYADFRLLEQDLAQARKLAQLADSAPAVQAVWAYLEGAPVPSEMAELSIERQALAVAVASASLLGFSRPWPALAQQISDFKSRYAIAYRALHQELNQSLIAYRRNLDAAHLKQHALELLNSIPNLGQPAGAGLESALAGLDPSLVPCNVATKSIDLEVAPQCSNCGLTLELSLDTDGLSRLIVEIDAALGEKNRMLSNLLVDKILQGQVDQSLEDFLKIVQASDLSALSNTITEELASFIRRVLV